VPDEAIFLFPVEDSLDDHIGGLYLLLHGYFLGDLAFVCLEDYEVLDVVEDSFLG